MLRCVDVLGVFVAWRLVVKRRIYLRDATFDLVAGAISSSSMRAMAVSRYVEYHLSGYRGITDACFVNPIYCSLVASQLCCRRAFYVSVLGFKDFWSLFSSGLVSITGERDTAETREMPHQTHTVPMQLK